MPSKLEVAIPDLPHGHGMSFKRGLADGLLRSTEFKAKTPITHLASYRLGHELGVQLKNEIANQVG